MQHANTFARCCPRMQCRMPKVLDVHRKSRQVWTADTRLAAYRLRAAGKPFQSRCPCATAARPGVMRLPHAACRHAAGPCRPRPRSPGYQGYDGRQFQLPESQLAQTALKLAHCAARAPLTGLRPPGDAPVCGFNPWLRCGCPGACGLTLGVLPQRRPQPRSSSPAR